MSKECDELIKQSTSGEDEPEDAASQADDPNAFVLRVKGHVIKSVEELPIYPVIRQVVNCSYEISRRPTFVKDTILVEDVRRVSIKMLGSLVSGFDMGSKEFLIDHLV